MLKVTNGIFVKEAGILDSIRAAVRSPVYREVAQTPVIQRVVKQVAPGIKQIITTVRDATEGQAGQVLNNTLNETLGRRTAGQLRSTVRSAVKPFQEPAQGPQIAPAPLPKPTPVATPKAPAAPLDVGLAPTGPGKSLSAATPKPGLPKGMKYSKPAAPAKPAKPAKKKKPAEPSEDFEVVDEE